MRRGGRLVIWHGKSRDEINEFHQKSGDVVAGHAIPGDEELGELLRSAGFEMELTQDRLDRFLVVGHAARL